MKKMRSELNDEIRGELAALRRASRNARKLAETTGTPFIVVKNGKTVNLNPVKKRSRKIA